MLILHSKINLNPKQPFVKIYFSLFDNKIRHWLKIQTFKMLRRYKRATVIYYMHLNVTVDYITHSKKSLSNVINL